MNIREENHSLSPSGIYKSELNPRHFFEELITAMISRQMLSNAEFESIQQQLLELLEKQVKAFNKESSSSIKVEVAEALMESIYYTLSIYFKELEEIQHSGACIKEKGLASLFIEGKALIHKKVERAKLLLERVQQTKIVTANYAYNDTVDKGLGLFFVTYDKELKAQDTPGSIDYFLSYTERQEIIADGIEYLEKYLGYLYLENIFCSYFDNEEIEVLLYSYDEQYEHLLFNIFDCVLINSLGNILLGNEEGKLLLSKEEVETLQLVLERYTIEELTEQLKEAAVKLYKLLDIEEYSLISYINLAITKIAVELKYKLELKQPQYVFIAHQSKKVVTYYIDGERMTNSDFKELTDEIRECSTIGDKVKLIKNLIHSMYDLVDVLKADCLFTEEYLTFFSTLTLEEINLLINYELGIQENTLNTPIALENLKEKVNLLLTQLETKEQQIGEEETWQSWLLVYLKQLI